MKILPYHPSDFPEMLGLGLAMHAESDFARFEFAVEKIERLSELLMTNPDWFGLVARTNSGELAGAFVGGATEFFFSPERHGFDVVFYVFPKFRSSTAAVRLFATALTRFERMDVGQLRFGHATGILPEVADRLFRSFGFRQGGVLYLRDI